MIFWWRQWQRNDHLIITAVVVVVIYVLYSIWLQRRKTHKTLLVLRYQTLCNLEPDLQFISSDSVTIKGDYQIAICQDRKFAVPVDSINLKSFVSSLIISSIFQLYHISLKMTYNTKKIREIAFDIIEAIITRI